MAHIEAQVHLDDYHGHPNYFSTYLILLGFLGLSLVAGMLHNWSFALASIFIMAIIKILFVVNNFMHLKYEPLMIWFAAAFGLMCVCFFYFGVYPDLILVPLEVAK